MTRKNAKVGSPELDAATLKVLKEAGMPVSIQHVAKLTKVAWHQARSQLFKLAMERKIKGINTTKSWIFTMDTDTPEITPVASHVAFHSHPDQSEELDTGN